MRLDSEKRSKTQRSYHTYNSFTHTVTHGNHDRIEFQLCHSVSKTNAIKFGMPKRLFVYGA